MLGPSASPAFLGRGEAKRKERRELKREVMFLRVAPIDCLIDRSQQSRFPLVETINMAAINARNPFWIRLATLLE